MKVNAMTVGPIVGATTDRSVRLFGRGDLELVGGRPRKTHGIVRIKGKRQRNYKKPRYFKLNPNFDMTGVAIIDDLQTDQKYDFQMGWIFSEVDTNSINVSKLLGWNDASTGSFKTASSNDNQPRVIVAGSCRYILRLLGGNWFDDRGDKTFRSILKQLNHGEVDQLIMCGDQIYADDRNIFTPELSMEELFQRYRDAFTSENLRKLMSNVPTYMTLDDHEIEDNWPKSANKKDWVTKFPKAIHAYSTYQLSHSPLFGTDGQKLQGTPTHLWYTYTDGCCDFFMCDTRTERYLAQDQREMIGPRQLEALLGWLTDETNRVKVIISSVPFYELESDDKWNGFIGQRDQILETIRSNSVRRVVIISGDVHASMASELTEEGNSNFKIVSIVSSAFFWPYPHPMRRSFKLTGNIDTYGYHQYKVENATNVWPTDAFVRIELNPDSLEVIFYSRKNDELERKKYEFPTTSG